MSKRNKGGPGAPGFGEAKPMVGAGVHTPIDLLRKHAATHAMDSAQDG